MVKKHAERVYSDNDQRESQSQLSAREQYLRSGDFKNRSTARRQSKGNRSRKSDSSSRCASCQRLLSFFFLKRYFITFFFLYPIWTEVFLSDTVSYNGDPHQIIELIDVTTRGPAKAIIRSVTHTDDKTFTVKYFIKFN